MTERNFFREKLYHHTMPVNEGLWSAIEAQLPPEQKQKRFPVFWMTLFGTTLLGGALMIGVFTQKSVTNTSPQPIVEQQQVIASAMTTSNTSIEQDAIGASSSNENSDNKATTSTTTLSSSNTLGSGASADLTPTSGKSGSKRSFNSPKPSVTKQTNTNNSKTKMSPVGIITANNSQPSNQTNSASQASTAAIDNALNSAILPYRNTSVTSLLPLTEMNQANSSINLMTNIAPDPNCYKFGDIGAHYALSLDVLGGIGFSPKTYEQNSGENQDYISARKATEQNQYAWSFGARLNLHHRSGLTGRLGLQYTQVGDVFDYRDSLATQTTTRIDSFFAADGTFLYTEVTQVLIDGTLVKKIHNTYRYVDIPLLVGYEMRLGRNIVMLNVGPVFNLTQTHEGQILDSMLHPRSITPGAPGAIDIYKTNVGVSLYFGAGILFPLTDRLSALIEPSYLYRLSPVTLNSYELKEKRHYASLNLGVRYHIN